jgi:hypothetical protein
MVFMESASQGRFFEFNPGETVSGETSPGYMMLGALLFRLLPAAAIPIALKIVGLIAWYAFCWFVYRVARRLLDDAPIGVWAAVAAFAAATLPGSVYNANSAMENGVFAALLWGWIDLANRWRWFESAEVSLARELTCAFVLGLSCWFRPEAALVAFIAYLFRLVRVRPLIAPWLGSGLTVVAIGGASVLFQYVITGDLVATSILSRRVLAMPHFVSLGVFAIDPTFAKRLLVYLPLTLAFLYGLRASAGPFTSTERFLQLTFGVFFALYTIVGTPQIARYAIFLMPILVIGAVRGARAFWLQKRNHSVLAIAALALVAAGAFEVRYRMEHFGWGLLRKVIAGPARRHDKTDDFLRQLNNPRSRPVVVATESVQIRYELDDRVVVRSLDGRVDRTLLAFVQRDAVDHAGYLKARRVAYLLQTPAYNRDPSAWSLQALRQVDPDAEARHDGLQFRRLASTGTFTVSVPP